MGLLCSMRHEHGSSAAQEQLSKLEAACKRLLLAPIDHSRALQDIMQDERAEIVDRATGLEIRTVSVIEPRTTIKGGSVSRGGVSVHVLPMQHVRWWLRFRSNRTASVITQLLGIRPDDNSGFAKSFASGARFGLCCLHR